jgi:hypothetical protein
MAHGNIGMDFNAVPMGVFHQDVQGTFFTVPITFVGRFDSRKTKNPAMAPDRGGIIGTQKFCDTHLCTFFNEVDHVLLVLRFIQAHPRTSDTTPEAQISTLF